MRPINVISACDGIGCSHAALNRANIPIADYYSFEIDKYAIAVNQFNHPETIQLGDLNLWKNHIGRMGVPDLIIGSTPCQNLSICGDRTGLEGQESRLFWKFKEIVDCFPNVPFVFENVASMTKENANIISTALGVEPIMINAALVSAQNRKRYFWTNIPSITQPTDRSVYLKDILENGETDKLKSFCLSATYAHAYPKALLKNRRTQVFNRANNNSTICLSANPIIYQRPHGYNKGKLIVNKAPSLTSHSWVENNLLVKTPCRLGVIGNGGQGARVYSVLGKSVCLSANGGGHGAKTGLYKIDLPDGDYIIRKLTPLECERLTTLLDNYTQYGDFDDVIKPISNAQRYKMLGNGIVVEVLVGIFEKLKEVIVKHTSKLTPNNGKTCKI